MSDTERIAALEARLAALEARMATQESKRNWPDVIGPINPSLAPGFVHISDRTESYADRCPCNPKNGGSGVCNCVLGRPTVTCQAGGSS